MPHSGLFRVEAVNHMRALLLVPPDCATPIETLLLSDADGLVLDFVQTVDRPSERERVLALLLKAQQSESRPALYVRIGGLNDADIDADLDAIMPGRPDGIFLQGSQNGADVQHLSVKLAVREAEHGLADGATKIIATAAETPAAIFQMASFVGASDRLAGLVHDRAALGAVMALEKSMLLDGAPTPAFSLARSLTVFAAGAAGVAAIDAVSPQDCDAAAFRHDCELARRDGFSGKLAVHEDQVAMIHAVFARQ